MPEKYGGDELIRFIGKRLLQMIPVLLGVLLLIFILGNLMPGDPVMSRLGSSYTQEEYDELSHEMGLDRPIIVQFCDYVYKLVTQGEMGTSYNSYRSVKAELDGRISVTFKIGILATTVTILISIPLGILSATKQYSVLDYSVTTVSLILASLPGFWLALMMMLLFSLKLGWLPSGGLQSWKGYIMPILANALMPLASIVRMTRSSMLEVIRPDYIRTARAKGVPERTVIMRHALKNALIPVITVIGMQISMIAGGSVIVESIYSIPGIGVLLMTAINNRDYPIIQGVVLIISLFVCVVNLLTDIVYALVDPRIRAQFTSGSKKRKTHKKAEEAAA